MSSLTEKLIHGKFIFLLCLSLMVFWGSGAQAQKMEAIEYLKEKPVDLIVLDMVMPKGINGRETYEEIIKIRSGQKAVIANRLSYPYLLFLSLPAPELSFDYTLERASA